MIFCIWTLERFTFMAICVTDTGNTMIHVPITQVHTTTICRYISMYVLIDNYHRLYVYPLRYMINCNSYRAQNSLPFTLKNYPPSHLLSPPISICIVCTSIIVHVVLLFPLTDSHPLSPFMDINENQLRFTFVIFFLLPMTRRLCSQ